MKKLSAVLLSCFLLAAITVSAQAQSQSPQVGIKGGLNIANFVNTDLDTDHRTGGIIGLVLDFSMMNAPVGIETGVFYSQKGADLADDGPTLNVDYLEVPVLAKLFFNNYAEIRPHLLVGPYVGYNINTEGELELDPDDIIDVSDEARDIDFGIQVGVGTDFNIGMSSLDIQARYGLGLIPVFEEEFDEDIRHGVFSITLGLKF